MTAPDGGFTPIAFYDYLATARRKLWDWIRPLSMEQYTREFPFGRKTLRATVVEIPLAEWSYSTRLIGEPVPPLEQHPFNRFYSADFAALEAAWTELEGRTRRILTAERDWGRVVQWRTVTKPQLDIRATAGGVATQMMGHEIHHRAQAMAMLRQLGVAAQNLDYSILIFQRTEVPA